MRNQKSLVLAVAALSLLFFANQAVSQSIKFNAIKPGAKQTQNLTDEQQAILAVRKAKASVINILGVPPVATTTESGLTVKAELEEVSGTGFVLESNGLIVTNNHVVSDGSLKYYVVMPDGSRYPITILAQDTFDDLAFLKIDAGNLTPAELGDSDALETGQTVFAIGNSVGRYQNSVSRGVVAGLGRVINDASGVVTRLHNLIQTDAAISPGNSGGPLIDMAGEVVGMNTLIDTSGSSLGFAVPINAIKDALSQYKTFGQISRPYLGIQFSTIDPELQLADKLPVDNGALVVAVGQGSPAQQAGLHEGDIILAVNGQALSYTAELDAVLQKYQAGSQLTLKILSGGQTLELPVILGEYK